MELLDATQTEAGTVRVTFAHPDGVTVLEGTLAEVQALSSAMAEVALLATAADDDVWVRELRVGADSVRLGILPGQRTRLRRFRAQD
jgi:hypothetical protein